MALIHFSPLASRRLAMRSGNALPISPPMLSICLSPLAPHRRAIRCASMRAASAFAPRSRTKRSKRVSISSPCPPRPRSCNRTANIAASSACPLCAATATIWARLGGKGKLANIAPCEVMCPCASSASTDINNLRACCTAAAGGRSSQRSFAGSFSPHRAQSSNNGARSLSSISGGSNGGKPPFPASSHSR